MFLVLCEGCLALRLDNRWEIDALTSILDALGSIEGGFSQKYSEEKKLCFYGKRLTLKKIWTLFKTPSTCFFGLVYSYLTVC